MAVSVTNLNQLLWGNRFPQEHDGVEMKLFQPKKLGAVIGPAAPHEKPRVGPGGSVHASSYTYNGKSYAYRMHYDVTPELYSPTPHRRNAIALSNDGITWIRPDLGQELYKLTSHNNIIATASWNGPAYYDTNSSLWRICGNRGQSGTEMYYSTDGITSWTRPAGLQTTVYADSYNQVLWDSGNNTHSAYYRGWTNATPSKRGVVKFDISAANIVGTWPSLPTTWSKPSFGSVFDAADSDYSMIEIPAGNYDIYHASVFKYAEAEASWFAMCPIYYWTDSGATDGLTNIHLAMARTPTQWRWIDGDGKTLPFIPHGEPVDPDSGTIYTICGYLNTGSRLLFYYSGDNHSHGSGYDPIAGIKYRSAIFAAELRLDGFVSVRFGPSGYFTTVPLTFTGTSLSVNVDASRGTFQAAFLDTSGNEISGFGANDCTIIREDSTSKTLSWAGGSLAGISQPASLKFIGSNCDLFSFKFS